LLYFIIVYK